MRNRLRSLALRALVAVSLHATAALAQSPELTGLARAAGDKHVLSCISVTLEDSAGRDVASTRTDARGLFAIAAPGAGIFRLRFEMEGARPVRGPVDTLSAGAYSEHVYELPFVARDPTDAPLPPSEPDEFRQKPNGVFPRYPLSLREANIEGSAVAEFVVDSSGAVEDGSIRIVRQTQTEFGRAVTNALPRMAFYPQHDHGVAVCQRTMLPVAFALDR